MVGSSSQVSEGTEGSGNLTPEAVAEGVCFLGAMVTSLRFVQDDSNRFALRGRSFEASSAASQAA